MCPTPGRAACAQGRAHPCSCGHADAGARPLRANVPATCGVSTAVVPGTGCSSVDGVIYQRVGVGRSEGGCDGTQGRRDLLRARGYGCFWELAVSGQACIRRYPYRGWAGLLPGVIRGLCHTAADGHVTLPFSRANSDLAEVRTGLPRQHALKAVWTAVHRVEPRGSLGTRPCPLQKPTSDRRRFLQV